MALPQSEHITVKEYLALDADSDSRYEYLGGTLIAMAGASREHNVIVSNTHITTGTQLRDKPCEIYQSEMRVQTKADKSYPYPELALYRHARLRQTTHTQIN